MICLNVNRGELDEEWCPCAPNDDPGHCECWYEGEECCRCRAPAESISDIARSAGWRDAIFVFFRRIFNA